jgi:hypothetical protein
MPPAARALKEAFKNHLAPSQHAPDFRPEELREENRALPGITGRRDSCRRGPETPRKVKSTKEREDRLARDV